MSPSLFLIKMNLAYISFYISIIIWAIIPFRQVGKKYFYYFLLFAILDPIILFVRIELHSTTNYLYLPFSFLILASIQNTDFLKKYRIYIFVLFILISIVSLNNFIMDKFFLFMGIIHLLIFLKFIKNFIISFVKDNTVNIFLILLVFYEITIVAKNFNILSGLTDAHTYFVITSIFEAFIGLFFCIFKSDNPRLLLQFK